MYYKEKIIKLVQKIDVEEYLKYIYVLVQTFLDI